MGRKSEDRQACSHLLHAAGCMTQSLAALSLNAQPIPGCKLLTQMQFPNDLRSPPASGSGVCPAALGKSMNTPGGHTLSPHSAISPAWLPCSRGRPAPGGRGTRVACLEARLETEGEGWCRELGAGCLGHFPVRTKEPKNLTPPSQEASTNQVFISSNIQLQTHTNKSHRRAEKPSNTHSKSAGPGPHTLSRDKDTPPQPSTHILSGSSCLAKGRLMA